ncbi:Uncharacterised protein [Chromobacterium violaceum]|uniref:Uncharacterized protein n=1 Tax=Chromobacterium violaceum TaxID=536 RepID=A0A3S4I851_CHRVL|nr:Uncharacterised protein [Chromobacterium violaceum]
MAVAGGGAVTDDRLAGSSVALPDAGAGTAASATACEAAGFAAAAGAEAATGADAPP